MQYKILVVDDERHIVNLLKDYLELEGYLVLTAFNGKEAIEKAEKLPDLILLDINMPDMDGLEVCRRIRDHVRCPIVFLTAKVEKQDRLEGLMVGGDDYILKPFDIEELEARITAHLRREARVGEKEQVRFAGELTISYSRRSIFVNGHEISLTKTEFDILELLSLNKGQVFSKERIYERLWGYESGGDSAIVMEHIRRIRQKLARETDKVYIETIWGVGYRWIG